MVFAALVEAILTAGLEQRGRGGVARRIDRWARAIAPAILVFLLWRAFVTD